MFPSKRVSRSSHGLRLLRESVQGLDWPKQVRRRQDKNSAVKVERQEWNIAHEM